MAPPTDDPISLFILGPSRSGKTSLERLLGTIPGVRLGYENPIADNAVRKTLQLSGYLSSGRFLDLPPVLESACRQRYLEELRIRAAGAM